MCGGSPWLQDAAVRCGFACVLVKDATRPVGLPGTVEAADEGIKEAGVTVVDSGGLGTVVKMMGT